MSEQPAVAAAVAAPVPLPDPSQPVATSVAVEAPPPVVEFTPPEPPSSLLSSTPAEETPQAPAASSPAADGAAASSEVPPSPEEGAAAAEPVTGPAAETAAEPAAPEPIAYEPFDFGEGVEVPADDPYLARFTKIAGEELRLPQEAAQKLAGVYGEAAREYAQTVQRQMVERQFAAFNDTVKGWETQFREDPEFANRQQTVLEDANWVLRRFGGNSAQLAELDQTLRATGIGNHRAQIRLLSNIARAVRPLLEEPRQYQGGGRAPTVTPNRLTPAERRYGTG